MTYEAILDRDVPAIRDHARACVIQGICVPIRIYYRHEAIAGQSIAINHDMAADGWTPSDVEIPCNLPYTQYWQYLYKKMTKVPLFA